MVMISSRAVLVLSLLVSMTVWAQERDKPIPATDSADQLIAETIWSLVDLETMPEDAAEFAGKPISPYMWRSMIENLFSQLLAIDGGTTVSESSLRGLGSVILQHSHRLSPQEDVRYLRAFVGVGLHLIDSNRLIFGGTAAAVERVLHRLENIAIDQGDFQHVDELLNTEKHVRNVQRQVFNEYRAAEMGVDTLDAPLFS